MKLTTLQLACLVLVAGIALIVHAASFPDLAGMAYGPSFFPTIIGAGFVACSIGFFVEGFAGHRAGTAAAQRPASGALRPRQALGLVGVLAAIGAFMVLTPIAGFIAGTALVSFGVFLMFGVSPARALALSVVLPVGLFFLFEKLLRVPLPAGLLERLF